MPSGLATRCSACGTVFRVVPDQLRVSEGWVRCGRCSQVFNALESLVDLDTGMPRASGHGGDSGLGVFDSGPMPMPAEPEAPLDVAEPAARPGAPPLPPPPPPAVAAADDFASTAGPELADDTDGDGVAAAAGRRLPAASELLSAAPASPMGDFAADPAPSFVRQADRAARWRRPGVRLALAALALLAGAVLAAQAAHTWRDRLAARVPATAPLLAQACQLLGCEVGAARQLDALSVESSGLVRVERSNLYRLQLSLRNRAEHAVALPALDLTLTDARGELVARRVVMLAELGAASSTLAGGRELALQGTLQAANVDGGTPVIAGYTVELFYP